LILVVRGEDVGCENWDEEEGPGDGVCRFRSGDRWRWAAFLRIDLGFTWLDKSYGWGCVARYARGGDEDGSDMLFGVATTPSTTGDTMPEWLLYLCWMQ
jgi:hypothetical protein